MTGEASLFVTLGPRLCKKGGIGLSRPSECAEGKKKTLLHDPRFLPSSKAREEKGKKEKHPKKKKKKKGSVLITTARRKKKKGTVAS